MSDAPPLTLDEEVYTLDTLYLCVLRREDGLVELRLRRNPPPAFWRNADDCDRYAQAFAALATHLRTQEHK